MRAKILPILLLPVLACLPAVWPGASGAQPVGTDQSGDPVTGAKLAQAWCSECHAVAAKTGAGERRGPDFVEIANRAKTTALSLNVFLRSNHDNMPNFIVARGDADDIVAYILSLKGK